METAFERTKHFKSRRLTQLKTVCAFVLAFLFTFFQLLCVPANAKNQETVIKVGILNTIDPWFFVWSFGDSIEHLRKDNPNLKIESRELSFSELQKAIEAKELDFFIAPSGFFAFVSESAGAAQLATFHRELAADPGKSVGSVFVKRAGDERYKKLADLTHAKISATDSNSFEGWIIAIGELRKQGLDIERIIRNAVFTGYGLPDVLTFLLNGSTDVGVLKACELEHLIDEGTIKQDDFEVIGEKTTSELKCRVSTNLYPDVVFASLPKAPSALVKAFSVSLLTMPKVGYGTWGFASDFSTVHELYRTLRLGPYEYLRHLTPTALLYEYRYVFYGFLALLLLALFYIYAVNKLVRRRTKALQVALEKKERAQEEARNVQERLFQLEKAGIVQELSAMFAHEAHQPIASLINYSEGLKMYFSQNKEKEDSTVSEALEEMSAQAERLSQIINRVRRYARKEKRLLSPVKLNEVAETALNHVVKTRGASKIDFRIKAEEDAYALADSLEIELVLVNFLKNSIAALNDKNGARVEIQIGRQGVFWKMSVLDNGKFVSDDEFEKLSQPIRSRKENGLGMGLSICKVIAENHGGKIMFERRSPGGLIASILLPQLNEGKQNGN